MAAAFAGLALCWGSHAFALAPAGMQGWDIVIETNAPPAVRYAAEEFQRLFAEAAGATLPITNRAPAPARHIFIGSSAGLTASPAACSNADLEAEDLRIRVTPDAIGIVGGSPRGTLYGVYTFVENHLGVRFLTPDHTYVPKAPRWWGRNIIPEGEKVFRPALSFRHCDYGANGANPAFAVRLRLNAITDDPRLGGRSSWDVINHSVANYVSVRAYGTNHPDYFALVNGVRRSAVPDDHYGGGGTQPCMTNPDVLRLIRDGVLKTLTAQPGRAVVSVSQNDNGMYCTCDACRAIDEREGSHMGALLTLVNAVADDVATAHPGVFVGTLAYQYSRKPPATLKPRPNAAIQLCSIEACLMHAINDPACPLNTGFRQDLAGWSRLTDRICIWNYNVNYLDLTLPCPNLRVIGPNIRFFVANRARGLFMEADGSAQGTDLADLRNYLICNLMWDPGRDAQALTEEFLRLHYGKAAGSIRAYINLIHDNAARRGLHHDCFGKAAHYGIDDSVAVQAIELFDRALAAADDEVVHARVEKASIGAFRAAIEPLMKSLKPDLWRFTSSDAPIPKEIADATRPNLRRFMALCDKYGVDMMSVSEPKTFADLKVQLRKRLGLKPDEPW